MIYAMFLLLFALPATSQEKWSLVWADEFDGAGLPDSSNWRYDVGGGGWGNKELQYYTDARSKNVRVEEGLLTIEAHREDFHGRNYTSVRLVSKADWTYGRFAIRAKIPSGRGTWPAIWMLPTHSTYGNGNYWPDNGEIDILEHVGYDPDVVHASIHTRAYHHSIGTQRTAQLKVPTARSEFHVYAVEWTPEQIRGFIDDKLYFTFANERLEDPQADYRQWPFDRPFHFLLNIAVGGSWGGVKGVDETIWPQKLEIDYVRVFQRVADTAVEQKAWGEVKSTD
jgi:beta-glucanase (GH16 family)